MGKEILKSWLTAIDISLIFQYEDLPVLTILRHGKHYNRCNQLYVAY